MIAIPPRAPRRADHPSAAKSWSTIEDQEDLLGKRLEAVGKQ